MRNKMTYDLKTYLEEEIARVELNAANLYLSIVVSNDYTKLQQYHQLEEAINSLKNDLSRAKEHHGQNSVRSTSQITSQMLTWGNILPRGCLLRAWSYRTRERSARSVL